MSSRIFQSIIIQMKDATGPASALWTIRESLPRAASFP